MSEKEKQKNYKNVRKIKFVVMPHQILQKCLEIKKVKKLRRLVHHKLNNFQSKMNMTMHKQKNSKNKETQTLLSFIKKFNKCRY